MFTRSPRGVVITESGELLLSGARRLLDAAATLRREVATPMATTMKIGATTTSARSLLAPYLSEWIPNHLDVHLTAVEDSDLQLQIRLENGDCDVAVISGVPSSTLESLKIASVQVMAMMPFGHRLAQSEGPVSVVDLSQEPLLLNGPGYPSTNLTLHAMEVAGLTPNIVFQCSAGPTLAAMAEAGLGVAVFGNTTNLQGHSLCRRQVLDASGMRLTFNLYIAWKRGSVSSTVKEFGVGLATFLRQRGYQARTDADIGFAE